MKPVHRQSAPIDRDSPIRRNSHNLKLFAKCLRANYVSAKKAHARTKINCPPATSKDPLLFSHRSCPALFHTFSLSRWANNRAEFSSVYIQLERKPVTQQWHFFSSLFFYPKYGKCKVSRLERSSGLETFSYWWKITENSFSIYFGSKIQGFMVEIGQKLAKIWLYKIWIDLLVLEVFF